MPGISGEDDEQPARRRAAKIVSKILFGKLQVNIQRRMIAMAMRIMRTWW